MIARHSETGEEHVAWEDRAAPTMDDLPEIAEACDERGIDPEAGYDEDDDRRSARDFDRQVTELQVRVAILNGFTALGIPVTETIG